jgi:hypothetical protein
LQQAYNLFLNEIKNHKIQSAINQKEIQEKALLHTQLII